MAQIYYHDNLVDQLGINRLGARATGPMTSWYVEPVGIADKTYYLYVEGFSGLPIIANELGWNFKEILSRVVNNFGFLTAQQYAKLLEHTSTDRFYYDNNAYSLMLTKYQQLVAKHQTQLASLLATDPSVAVNRQLEDASLALLELAGQQNQTQTLEKIIQVANELFYVKTNRPAKRAQYCTITPQFNDPRQWKSYEGQAPSALKSVINEIRQNNQRMIEQFINTDMVVISEREEVNQLLQDYLNYFLLDGKIRLVTTNLADANVYYWSVLTTGKDADFVSDYLSDFYKFLSMTGIIRQSEARKVSQCFDDTYKNMMGDDLSDYDNEMIDNFFDTDSDLLTQLLKSGELPAGVIQRVQPSPVNVDYQNKTRNQQTYEITAKLRGFKPSIRRRFKIAGGQTIAYLQAALVVMFEGMFEHMYDFYNWRTRETFELPKFSDEEFDKYRSVIDATKAKISYLKPNDHLVLTYDFGDNWEIDVQVKQVLDEPGPKYPEIITGKGYGIIEDIGGVDALQQYYHDYQHEKVASDIAEWIGDINLDDFDKDSLNDALQNIDTWIDY